nr:MAG TPA: hypothetical protein [Caudoviricetes sp.]
MHHHMLCLILRLPQRLLLRHPRQHYKLLQLHK